MNREENITLKNVFFRYGEEYLLQDFSLSLPHKGSVCLFGPSGSGKTTLLRLLCGLERPERGEVQGVPERVAVLFQENRLLPQITALDNLKLVLSPERANEAQSWLERVGLGADAGKTPQQMSGGMNRRLAIARTLAYGGDVYLLDEPFQGLDKEMLQQMICVIREATKDALLILVTHHREEAEELCRRMVILGERPLHILADNNFVN